MRTEVIIFTINLRRASFTMAALLVAQCAATSASAGLLDFLFRHPQQPALVAPAPHGANTPAPGPSSLRPTRSRTVRTEPSKPRPYQAPQVGAEPLGRFLHDSTLRRGDVVATPIGLMVFQGKNGAANHRPSDFKPVANAASAKRDALVALDKSMRRTPSVLEEITIEAPPLADKLRNERLAQMAVVQSTAD